MAKLVLPYIILLRVAVSKNLLRMLSEDLLYIKNLQKLCSCVKMESDSRLRKL